MPAYFGYPEDLRRFLLSSLFLAQAAGCTLTDLEGLQGGQGGAASSAATGTAGAATSGTGSGTGPEPVGYAAVVFEDQPIAYWRLDEERSTAAVDSVSGAHSGEYIGGVVLGSPGAVADPNTAVLLNGTDAYVEVLAGIAFVDNAPFSVEAWIEPSSIDGFRAIATNARFDDTSGVVDGYRVFVADGVLRFQRSSARGLAILEAETSLSVDQYSHIVAVYDGSTMKLFVNAEVVGLLVAPAPIYTLGGFAIGADLMHNSGPTGFFAGSIDEVAVYDHALSAERITAHFQAAQ